MSWSYWFCDTITGVKQLQVEPASGSFGRLLNTAGSGSHTFKLGDRKLSREVWRGLTTPWARTLVQCWEGDPVYAGVITGRPYNPGTMTLTLPHTDIRSMFMARYPFGVASYWADELAGIPGNLTVTNRSIVAALGLVVQAGLQGPPGAAPYALPIVLPTLTTPGAFSRVFENFNFAKVADIITELQELDGGPDVDFAPRWSASGTLEWVLRAGALTGGTFEFNLSAADNPVASFDVAEDALKQVTGVFGVGRGSGADMVVGGTPGAPVVGIPARDEVAKWTHVPTNAEASSLAREQVRVNQYPKTQPALKVLASTVDPRTLVLGSKVSTFLRDDPFLLDGPDNGWTHYRLVGFNGGVGQELTLEVR